MPLRLNSPLPSLSGAVEWQNGQTGLLVGVPVLVYFWSVSCRVCRDNMPRLQMWRTEFVPYGLKMIAIHAPRQESDTDLMKVLKLIKEFGIVEPCAIDNRHDLMAIFENRFWPAYFLFDREGKLRRRTTGDAGILILQPVLEQLIRENQPA